MHKVIRAWQKTGGGKRQEERYQQKCWAGRWHQLARAGIGDTFTRVPSASLLYEKTAKYCSVNVWNVMDGGLIENQQNMTLRACLWSLRACRQLTLDNFLHCFLETFAPNNDDQGISSKFQFHQFWVNSSLESVSCRHWCWPAAEKGGKDFLRRFLGSSSFAGHGPGLGGKLGTGGRRAILRFLHNSRARQLLRSTAKFSRSSQGNLDSSYFYFYCKKCLSSMLIHSFPWHPLCLHFQTKHLYRSI